jgi:hypothetical protein
MSETATFVESYTAAMRIASLIRPSTVALAVMLTLPSRLAAAPPSFTVRLDPAGNLGYQLDCLAEVARRCALDDFRALWDAPEFRRARDAEMLKRWVSIREASNTPASAAAFATVTSYRDVAVRAAGGLPTSRQREALEVVEHFRARFDTWWRTASPPVRRAFATDLRTLLSGPQVRDAVIEAQRALAVAAPTNIPTVAMIVLPGIAESSTNGGQEGDILVMEVMPEDAADAAVEIVLHEYVHLLYSHRSAEQNASLRAALATAGGARGIAMANLLNEGLATAIGNALWARRTMPASQFQARVEDSVGFYSRSTIHRAGVVYLEVLDSLRDGRRSIDEAASTIVEVSVARWPDVDARPEALLHDFVLITSERSVPDAVRHLVRAFRPVSIREVVVPANDATCDRLASEMQRFPYQMVVVVLPGAASEPGAGACVPPVGRWTAATSARGALRLTFAVDAGDRLAPCVVTALSAWRREDALDARGSCEGR